MRIGYHRRRIADVAAAARLSRQHAARARLPREQLAAYQRERLDAVLRHAREHSPLYRERLAGLGPGPIRLEDVAPLEKAEMMDRYDDLVTDARLRRDALLAWVEGIERDALYLDRYRVMTTSGSSGRKGLFVYDRDGWRAIVTQFLALSATMGAGPRFPRRLRLALVSGAAPTHMSRQGAATLDVGLHRILGLPVTLPLDRLVDALNRFDPDALTIYPSAAMRLAEEQDAGRLRLSLDAFTTTSELRTPAMTDRLVDAFGVPPFDLYATTEGLWAAECERHDGLHLFEDMALVENVDADGNPVAPGERGGRLLVTNLVNRVQPIIRLEVADVLTLDPEPCACGRTLLRAKAVEGRSDDALELPGGAGRGVTVHPAHFAHVTRDREVGEFQIVQEGPCLRLLVVPRRSAGGELEARLRTAVCERLVALGVDDPQIVVERRDELVRAPGGKLPLVVADPAVRGSVRPG